MYVTLSLLVERYFGTITDKNKIVDAIDKFCRDKVEPFIEQSYQRLADYMGAYQQRMVMKREVIADKGIWTAKKRYVLSVWDSEGVRYEKPDIKIMGIEAVRSSTPASCRKRIMDSMKIIMNGSNDELLDYIDEFREDFMGAEVAEIAFPRTVKGIDKYSHSVYSYIKGTPIHVKAVIAYNELIKQHGLEKRYPLIKNGEKIKFTYLKVPNPTRDRVIGFLNDLPSEFEFGEYINYDMQFEKAYLEPLKAVLAVVNWDYERIANLESFFV